MPDRQQICQLASRKLAEKAASIKSIKTLVGLDGFVDNIIAVVDKRHDLERYDRVRTIRDLADKIKKAAGHSSNYETVVTLQKLGGNGPIMANALAALGMEVSYIGSIGYPSVHGVFEEFARKAHVIGIAEPGFTDALEFEDGKLMLGKHQSLKDVNWDNLLARVGKDKLKSLMSDARLIGIVNWTMLPQMTRIWARLLDEVIPGLERRERKLFIDLCDPEKRTTEDLLEALKLLTRFQDHVDVILGLNLKESLAVAEVLGLSGVTDPEGAIQQSAETIRRKLGLSCVVIHPRKSAAAAIEGQSARIEGPFVSSPKISTGAGDHFNAGFCLGLVLGLGLEESLCTGVATSGYYVREAISPSVMDLSHFIANLPSPQRE